MIGTRHVPRARTADANAPAGDAAPPAWFLDMLRCPASGEALGAEPGALVSSSGRHRYRVTPSGIPLFAERDLAGEARRQMAHYDRIAAAYAANLAYPHTSEYLRHIDRATLAVLGEESLGDVVELCCGTGEALRLIGKRARRAVGVDVSMNMLARAEAELGAPDRRFAQGDATRLPLAAACCDTVIVLGGIHHVTDRARLFAEVARVLRPGGRFVWREPLNDFFLWRWLRHVVYRLSPMLDHATERPLRRRETAPALAAAGLALTAWRGCGLIGFCLFMNSDVLVVNRLFRFIPGIGAVTRFFARLDERLLRLAAFRNAGLLVVGAAVKPAEDAP